MKQETVYLICGPARHGKDSIATQIGAITGQTPMACSVQILQEMAHEVSISMISKYAMRRAKAKKETKILENTDHFDWIYRSLETAFVGMQKDVKGSPLLGLRHHLIALGDDKATTDPIYWIKAVVDDGGHIIPGVRRIAELKQGVAWLEEQGYDVKTVWIQRPDGPKVTDNLDFTSEEYPFDFLVAADEGAYGQDLMLTAAQHIVTKPFGNLTIKNDGVIFTQQD